MQIDTHFIQPGTVTRRYRVARQSSSRWRYDFSRIFSTAFRHPTKNIDLHYYFTLLFERLSGVLQSI